jgi:hypothetical protein
MNNSIAQAAALRNAFDRVEETYEFMLAYAAQGRKREIDETGKESQIRQYLKRLEAALGEIDEAIGDGLGGAEGAAFTERVRADLAATRSAVGLLLARPSISSDMIDNTNGLIVLRGFLTDVFFIDQAVLPPR